jgi:hypothetical protein
VLALVSFLPAGQLAHLFAPSVGQFTPDVAVPPAVGQTHAFKSQLLWPVASWLYPEGQFWQAVLALAATSVEYIPAAQYWQAEAADDPVAVLYLPAVHSLQSLAALLPSTSLYFPFPQSMHVLELWLSNVLYVPVMHAVQAVAPEATWRPTVDDHRPARHALHDESEICPVWSPYLPAMHDLQPYSVLTPFWSWYWPAEQAAQAILSPLAAWPAVHFWQLPDEIVSPGGQPAQRTSPLFVQSIPVAAGRPSLHVHTFCLQLLCPTSFWYFAASQFLQVTESVDAWSW